MNESRRRPSVAAELYGLGTGPSGWSRGPRTTTAVIDALVEAAGQLDRDGAEYLLLSDSPAPRFGPDIDTARPDSLLVASALSLHTRSTRLIPSVGLATTEPYHVSRAVATLDIVSGGRGGWNPVLDDDAQRVDRARSEREPAAPADRLERASEHIAVTCALATTWEPGAILADTASGRFLDAAKVRPIDPIGRYYPVGDPSPTPLPPSGGLWTVVDATVRTAECAARRADEIIVRADTLEEAHAIVSATREALGDRESTIRIAVTPYIADNVDDAVAQLAADSADTGSHVGIPIAGSAGNVVDEIARITASLGTPAVLLALPDTRNAPLVWQAIVTDGLLTAAVDA